MRLEKTGGRAARRDTVICCARSSTRLRSGSGGAREAKGVPDSRCREDSEDSKHSDCHLQQNARWGLSWATCVAEAAQLPPTVRCKRGLRAAAMQLCRSPACMHPGKGQGGSPRPQTWAPQRRCSGVKCTSWMTHCRALDNDPMVGGPAQASAVQHARARLLQPHAAASRPCGGGMVCQPCSRSRDALCRQT